MASNNSRINIKTRKPKTPVPLHAKDDKYYAYREKNTKTAAKCREKKRQADFKFKNLLFEVEEKNTHLKQKVIKLKEELNRLVSLYKLTYYNDMLFFNSIINNELI
jgi:hypothetical protein